MSDKCPLCDGDKCEYESLIPNELIGGKYIPLASVGYIPTTETATEISTAIARKLREYKQIKNRHMRIHQYIADQLIRRALTNNIARGLLLFYPMGTGKTHTFITLCVTINRPVIAIMPKVLVENTKLGIEKYCKATHKPVNEVMDMFSFASLDAYNMIDEIVRISNGNLNGYTIVVDEAHELFTQICNGNNKNGPTLYYMIMETVDLFVIFATGTPIEKDPYEIVPMANMILGQEVFPHDYKTFVDLFVGSIWDTVEGGNDKEGVTYNGTTNLAPAGYIIPNRWLLQNRLVGIVSHTIADASRFPRSLPTEVVHIPMDLLQWEMYVVAREKELLENAKSTMFNRGPGKKRFGVNGIGRAQRSVRTTFRQQSRAYCNVYYAQDGTRYNPKLKKIAADMTKWKQKCITCSQFKEFGIYALADELDALGWINLDPAALNQARQKLKNGDIKEFIVDGGDIDDDSDNDIDADVDINADTDIDENVDADADADADLNDVTISTHIVEPSSSSGPAKLIYAILSGETPIAERKRIIHMFNDVANNPRGEILCALLVTRVGTRGISLVGGRHAIACESYWTYARFRQFSARICRDGSHLYLPEDERTTQFHVYLSDKPESIESTEVLDHLDNREEGTTSDAVIYTRAVKRQYVLDEFMTVLKEVSIECSSLKHITGYDVDIECYQCHSETKDRLYGSNIDEDLRKGNPCRRIIEKKLQLSSIIVDGNKYMYSKDPDVYGKSVYQAAIYYYDANIDSFRRMSETDKRFMDVYNAI